MKNATSHGDDTSQPSTKSPTSTSGASPVTTVGVSVTVCVIVFIILMLIGRFYLRRRSRRILATRLNADHSENALHPAQQDQDRDCAPTRTGNGANYGKSELAASDENIVQWQIAELPSHDTHFPTDNKPKITSGKVTMEPVELPAYPYQLATKRNSVVRDQTHGYGSQKETPTGNDAELFKWYWKWNKELGLERSRHASIAGR